MTDENAHAEELQESEVRVQDHLEKNVEDQCGYCGQFFGPQDVVVEREIFGRTWRFCDEHCLEEFMENTDYQDDQDEEPSVGIPQFSE